MPQNDVDKINEFLDGNDEVYTLLYKKYIDDLFSYGMAISGNKERVKDAIQDIFYKILLNKKLLKDITDMKYYLFISLKNRLIDMNRSAVEHDDIESLSPQFTINDITILDNIISEEERSIISMKVKDLLNSLTSRQREAVCLRYIYNMEYSAIANILNMNNEKSARNLVSRAIEKLRSDNELILFFLSISHLV
jgi:RNA polymerase sigma factor (sigma-70 family)